MGKGSARRPPAYAPKCGSVRHVFVAGASACVCGLRPLKTGTQADAMLCTYERPGLACSPGRHAPDCMFRADSAYDGGL